MPTNKNAMTRYQILDELLSSRYHNYTLDDLTEEVSNRLAELYPESNGIGRRQIQKDIHYMELEGPFLAEIERYDVEGYDVEKQKNVIKHCLRYSQPGFSIFKKTMSDDEKYLLSEAMSLLGQFDGLPNLEELENLRLYLGLWRNNKRIVSFTKNPLENSNLFGELFTAISQKQVIELHYHLFSSPEVKKVNLHPHLLKEYNRRWYLIATAESDGKLLTFALDRINDAIPLPAHKYIPFDGKIEEHFDDVIGITVKEDSPLFKIVFWVSERSKDYVLTKPIHESQRTLRVDRVATFRKMYPHLDCGMFFMIECRKNYELIRELTSFGKDLIVLEPSAITDAVFERISDLNEEYEKLRTMSSQ